MQIRYSKPLGDLALEAERYLHQNRERLLQERENTLLLVAAEGRERCLLCNDLLTGVARLRHRELELVACAGCGHVQTANRPPPGYGHDYEQVYPELDPEAFRSRRERIYAPKLSWILEAAPGPADLLSKSWLELGSGAGGFLSALREAGAECIAGIDTDEHLRGLADQVLGPGVVEPPKGDFSHELATRRPDVVVAFFVLEHLETPSELAQALRSLPEGTLFAFSVPTFGLSAALESATNTHWARCIDGVLHTQVYTESSISHFLDLAGMEQVAQWVFGQDAQDLTRFLLTRLSEMWPKEAVSNLARELGPLQDEIQAAVDRAHLADARHVLAVRR